MDSTEIKSTLRSSIIPLISLIGLIGLSFLGTGCSTMTSPAIRQESGETLGEKQVRVATRFEASRLYSFLPAASPLIGVPQGGDVFAGTLGGLTVGVGALPKLDINGSAVLSWRGGGWRVGAKYQLLGAPRVAANGKVRNLAVAFTIGRGTYSSNGAVTYQTGTGTSDIIQTLSAQVWDFGFPVSYRITGPIQIIGGLTWYNAQVTGSFGDSFIADGANDIGMHLGVRVSALAKLEASLELTRLMIHDPFENSGRSQIYLGFNVAYYFGI